MTTWYARLRVYEGSGDSGYVYQRKIDLQGWQDTPKFAAIAIGLPYKIHEVSLKDMTPEFFDAKLAMLQDGEGINISERSDGTVLLDGEDRFFSGVANTKNGALLTYVEGEGVADFVEDEW